MSNSQITDFQFSHVIKHNIQKDDRSLIARRCGFGNTGLLQTVARCQESFWAAFWSIPINYLFSWVTNESYEWSTVERMSKFPTFWVVYGKIYVDNNLPISVPTNKCRHLFALKLVSPWRKAQALKGIRQLDAERGLWVNDERSNWMMKKQRNGKFYGL